jgi:hypothetical protein
VTPTLKRPPRGALRDVLEPGLSLPGVVAALEAGAPALQLHGRFMAGLATHPSAEPGTLVVRVSEDDRAYLLEEAPETYYLTDYYRRHAVVLVRLSRADRSGLRDILSVSWRTTAATRQPAVRGGAAKTATVGFRR